MFTSFPASSFALRRPWSLLPYMQRSTGLLPQTSHPRTTDFSSEYFVQESDSQLVPPRADMLLSQLHSPPIYSISDVDIISSSNPRLVEEINKNPFSNIPPLPSPKMDENARSYPTNQPRFRTLDKNAVICTYNACRAQFSRRSDLNRHYKAIHLRAKTFLCSFIGCARSTIGFSRKDKRDDHKRKIHGI